MSIRQPAIIRTVAALAAAVAFSAAGCSSMAPMPKPDELVVPQPLADSTGEFVSPYNADGELAGWVQKSLAAKAAETSGKVVAEAGGNLATNIGKSAAANLIPGVGGLLGSATVEAAGKSAKAEAHHQLAIAGAGGWDNIRGTSDQSFASLSDLAVFLYAKHSTHPQYAEALSATEAIYPELASDYQKLLSQAPRRQ